MQYCPSIHLPFHQCFHKQNIDDNCSMIFPLILGIVSLFGGRMVNQRKAQQESLSKLSDLIQEDLSGISAIKIYAQEKAEKKEFNIYNNAYEIQRLNLLGSKTHSQILQVFPQFHY